MSSVVATNRAQSATAEDADSAASKEAAGGDVPFFLRFRAWWDGCTVQQVLDDDARRAAEAKAAGEAQAEAGEAVLELPENLVVEAEAEDVVPGGYWSGARIAVNELLFGSGEIRPGGSERTLDLIGAFGLGNDVNVLQIGAGLGGTARAIALKYQGWVTGFEADPALALAAMEPARVDMEMSVADAGRKKTGVKVKLADKARVSHADLEALEIKPNVYDCAFACEIMHTISKKIELCDAVYGGLKPHASFLITDYFVKKGEENSPALKRWIDSERQTVHGWTRPEAEKTLVETGFDVRVIEDITALHRSDIFRGFASFVAAHERSRIPPGLIEPLLEFAEIWNNRVEAIDAGAIEVYKLVALRGEG